MEYVTVMLATFVSATLRGTQNKNVIGNHKFLAFFTAILMYTVDAATVVFVAKTGLSLAPFAGVGAGFGYIASMHLHRLLTRRKQN